MERTKIQNTIDRAVLAAADLDQTLDPSAVVTDYMDKAGVGQHLSEVNVNEGLNFRTVTATAQMKKRAICATTRSVGVHLVGSSM